MSQSFSLVANWLRQPSSVTGLSALMGAGAGVLGGQLTPTAAIPVLVFGAMAMLLPDNTAARQDARKLAGDALALAQGETAAAGVAPVVQDVASLVADLSAPPPAVPGG
jgi:hypothetical protein